MMANLSPSYRPPEEMVRNEQNTFTQIRLAPSKSLYISHFISTWNSRGFEFGAVLFLASIYPDTLLPMSVYALFRALAAIFFSPWVGRYIDKTARLSVVRLSIIGQRIPVALSCVGFLVLLSGQIQLSSALNKIIFTSLVFLACLEKLCSVMNTVSVERDWVVVIADNQEDILREMNSQMRRIDLFCKLISPLAIAILDGISTKTAVLVTLGVNATTVAAEYFLIARAFDATPALALQKAASTSSAEFELNLTSTSNSENQPDTQISNSPLSKSRFGAIQSYIGSAAFLPSFSLSILYFTVLSFSGQMTTYLLAVPSPRLTGVSVGVLRAISTIFELSSTFIAPRLISSIGAVRAGIWCLSWQAICLTSGVGLLIFSSSPSLPKFLSLREGTGSVEDSKLGVIALIVTVMVSRVGLWSFDLVAQLLIQNSIEQTHRGTFSAIEASIQNFFELCTFGTTIVWSKPSEFKYPATLSALAVWIAGACYAKFVRNQRGHLIHLPHCFDIDWSFGIKNEERQRYVEIASTDDDHELSR